MSDGIPRWEGEPADDWRKHLQSPDDQDRLAAVDALRHLEPPSATIPSFLQLLADPCRDVRALAAHALYDMAFDQEGRELLASRVGDLAPFVRDEYVEAAVNLVYLMEELGPDARPALPELHRLATGDDERLRAAAVDAIARID